MSKTRKGQMAITMVLSILLFLLLMFPVLNLFVQNEGRWSVKEKKSTAAFHLAEAGIDRARWKLMENDDFWYVTATGTLAGYHFDQVYTAEDGGTYTINISSDPVDETRRIVDSVGRDRTEGQVRRIRAVLVNDNNANFATRAANTVVNTGGGGTNHIEWGPVISGNSIDATGRTYPRYYSAGHVQDQDGGSTVASTDDVYWWSFYDIPPFPKVDFSAYRSSAIWFNDNGVNAPNGCGKNSGAKYFVAAIDTPAEFKNCVDTSNRTYYINGNAVFKSGSSNFIRGTVIVMGNVTIVGSGGASGEYDAEVPPQAWKEYGNAWNYYKTTFDSGCSYASYSDAVSANYTATPAPYHLDDVLLHGFLYVHGNQGLQGGGSARLHGVLLSNYNADMSTSNMCLYYDNNVAKDIMMRGVTIKLHSWYEVKGEWPSGL